MTTQTQTTLELPATIDPATRLGAVHYTVADLNRQMDFYQNVLGFKLLRRDAATAALGGGTELLQLTEMSGARRMRNRTGLYHTAFLVPTRWELAHLLNRIAETKPRIQAL